MTEPVASLRTPVPSIDAACLTSLPHASHLTDRESLLKKEINKIKWTANQRVELRFIYCSVASKVSTCTCWAAELRKTLNSVAQN